MKNIVKVSFFVFIITAVLFSCRKKNEDVEEIGKVTYLNEVYTNVDISTKEYGTAKKDNATISLTLDIYQATGAQETGRPLIILAHGGSFSSGTKAEARIVELSNRFAKRGYVVASIDYRLIADVSDKAKATFYNQPGTETIAAGLNAIWDTKAAIRFFKKKDIMDAYKIDTQKIFVGGFSAGAICALHAGYVKTPEEFKSLALGNQNLEVALNTYIKDNNGVEGNSGNNENSSSVKGIINIAGSVINTDIINRGEPIIVSSQATDDAIVPYESGQTDGTPIITYGAKLITARATSEGISNVLISIDKGGHSAFFDCEDCKEKVIKFVYDNIK